jgi:CheY-like chemotaxis protein
MEKRVLVVGLERTIYEKIEPILSRSPLSVDRVPKGESGMMLAERVKFDLLVVRYPLPDMATGSFINQVHNPGATNGATPILVMAEPMRLEEVRGLLPGGEKQAISINEPAKLLQEVACRLLKVAPRIDTRIPVRIEVQIGNPPALVLCQCENLSEGGMLVRSEKLYPIGTRLKLELSLPGERVPVRGDADIVRHTVPDVENVAGLGLRVRSYQGDGAARVRRFLSRKK